MYVNIILDCRYLMHILGDSRIMHVFREQNQVADVLAKEGMR